MKSRINILLSIGITTLMVCCSPISHPLEDPGTLPEVVDYNFHVKPILSDRCFACHGPDEAKREADLRLDIPQNGKYIEGGQLKKELLNRIYSEEGEVQMPPPESNLSLSPYEKAIIEKWIQQGANWKPHWAFTPPQKPELPSVVQADWPLNNLDYFILHPLEKQGLSPNEPASKATWLRRVSFDLTGLPPSPKAWEAFQQDTSAQAYERMVDQLLEQPAFGERMASFWLDLSRYADSHGYQTDGIRYVWPWRDWVIQAFNDNMPYDAFVTWQLAGDLMPHASAEQQLATAYNRHHPINSEAGIVDEEYRVEYVVDRINTLSTGIMGLSLGCARCHDHKYDPISQKEYYQVFAFFNSMRERGLIENDGNAGPQVPLTDRELKKKLRFLQQEIRQKEDSLQSLMDAVAMDEIKRRLTEEDRSITLENGLIAHYPLDKVENKTVVNQGSLAKEGLVKGTFFVEEMDGAKGIRFESQSDGIHLGGKNFDFERYEPFSFSFWLQLNDTLNFSSVLTKLTDKNRSFYRGYGVLLRSGKIEVMLNHRHDNNALQVRTKQALAPGKSYHIAITYDGSSRASGIKIYVDGHIEPQEILRDQLYKTIRTGNNALIYGNDGANVYLEKEQNIQYDRITYGGLRMYTRTLSMREVSWLAGITSNPAEETHADKEHFIRHYLLPAQELEERLLESRKKMHQALDSVMEVMVVEELSKARKTYVLNRGVYDDPTSEVEPGTPQHVLPFSTQFPTDRRGFSQWLFHPDHPLTSRVAVNHFWQLIWGKGLVKTTEDFGNQGELPSHPELLDYLAREFMDTGWDIKNLFKQIVLSAAYRQSSVVSQEIRREDMENTWYARGPNQRLSAEMLRDNALAMSGLLVKKVGGPSVMPYQPPGLWAERGGQGSVIRTYQQGKGDELYRRSLYTFIRRSAPPPAMVLFDAPDREYCVVRRQQTNTPLQALVLMNDPQFVEAARVFAARMMDEGGTTPKEKIRFGFYQMTLREPDQMELALLYELWEEEKQRFSEDSSMMDEWLAVGEKSVEAQIDRLDLASYTVVAHTLFNLDEFKPNCDCEEIRNTYKLQTSSLKPQVFTFIEK